MPSLAAMILPISGSRPSGASAPGFLAPMPGWSNFVPILMEPASFSLAIVDPAGKEASVSTSTLPPSSPPHAERASARTAAPASAWTRLDAVCRADIWFSRSSVTEDL
jgi:hypothetical protein